MSKMSLPANCIELVRNFSWQWENNTKETESQLSVNKRTWEPAYADNTFAAITVLEWAVKKKFWALKALKHGQRHNPPVENLYQHCYNEMGALDFWFHFATASNLASVNWNEVNQNIAWQRENDKTGVAAARISYRLYSELDGSEQELLEAIFCLLKGQSHNDPVMSLYRAAAREDATKLFQMV